LRLPAIVAAVRILLRVLIVQAYSKEVSKFAEGMKSFYSAYDSSLKGEDALGNLIEVTCDVKGVEFLD
jgi:hypothetical protein